MKLLVTHAVQLREEVDHLFIPRLVSIHRTYIMCPKFRGAPDIVRIATEGNVSIMRTILPEPRRRASIGRAPKAIHLYNRADERGH